MTAHSPIPKNITDLNLLRSMKRRRGLHMITRSKTHQSVSSPTSATSSEIQGHPGEEASHLSETVPGSNVDIPLADPENPSTDLRHHARGLIRKIKLFPNRVRRYWMILFPPLTPEQVEDLEIRKKVKLFNKLCRKECKKYGRVISDKLAQLGQREIIGNNTEGKPRKIIKIRYTKFGRDELFTKCILRIDTDPRHLPSYVRLTDLGNKDYYSDEMLPTLAHFMEFKSDEGGAFAVVYRHGLDGLPEFVSAEDIWKKVPENKPLLTFPVGYGDNSIRIDVDLDDCPHLIVAGATKQGKSNFINQILCFWLWRGLTRADLQLILFDLKRGMEFSFYEGLPHLYHDEADEIEKERKKHLSSLGDSEPYNPAIIETGIIEDLSDVMPALRRLRRIMDKRLSQIKAAGHKDFNSYNRAQHSSQKKLPSIVVIFDEWARIRLSLGTEPESMLAEMTNLARAAGMYVIIGTQNPNAAVISPLISVNFSVRVIFKCNVGGSMASLGNQAAVALEEKGRCILQDGGDQFKLQTPRISDGLIRAIVFKAITGKDKKSSSPVDLEEILQYSLDHFDGELGQTKLFAVFRDKKVKWEWLVEALRDSEGKEFDLSGTSYRIAPPGYHKGRRLERNDVAIETPDV